MCAINVQPNKEEIVKGGIVGTVFALLSLVIYLCFANMEPIFPDLFLVVKDIHWHTAYDYVKLQMDILKEKRSVIWKSVAYHDFIRY